MRNGLIPHFQKDQIVEKLSTIEELYESKYGNEDIRELLLNHLEHDLKEFARNKLGIEKLYMMNKGRAVDEILKIREIKEKSKPILPFIRTMTTIRKSIASMFMTIPRIARLFI